MKDDNVRCKRCHKIIVSPEARQRGYGELCWRKHLSEQQQKNSLFPLDDKRRRKN